VPLLLGCLSLAFPRVALFLVWLLGGNYLSRAYENWLWPLLGFVFLPLTTLAFAFGMNSLSVHGDLKPLGWLLVGIAAAIDLGLLGGGGRSAQRWQKRR
jgi:hypothetical protein